MEQSSTGYYARTLRMARELDQPQQCQLIDDLLEGIGIGNDEIVVAIERELGQTQPSPERARYEDLLRQDRRFVASFALLMLAMVAAVLLVVVAR